MRLRICSASSIRSSRRRWRACKAARWRSPSAKPAGSDRCRARCSRRRRCAKSSDGSRRARASLTTSTSSATQPPVPDAEREAAWRAALAPYYREFGLDLDAIPAAAARAPFSDAAADVLGDFKPAVVSFHFGLPSAELLARVRAWGAKVLSSATTVEEARWLEAHGADAIIAQGLEAGGHRGMFLSDDVTEQIGTLALVPQIVAAVKVPVIAAGGIVDASGVAAAMALGAAGVQVGTAYLLCPEATTSPIHRAALKGERRAPHRADQRLHRAAGARHREPDHARARTDQRGGAGVSARVLRDGAAARERRAPGPRRFLAAVVGRECQRLQRDSGGRSDARAGSRVPLMPGAQRPSARGTEATGSHRGAEQRRWRAVAR